MDVKVKELIQKLENMPRFYNPTVGDTVVIPETMAQELIKALKVRHRRKSAVVGAKPV